jgi:uncharacterized RDD family membrane protein YckC
MDLLVLSGFLILYEKASWYLLYDFDISLPRYTYLSTVLIFYIAYTILLPLKIRGTFGMFLCGFRIKIKISGRLAINNLIRREIIGVALFSNLRLIFVFSVLFLNAGIITIDSALYFLPLAKTSVLFWEVGQLVFYLWILINSMFLVFNKQQRSLHDYLGGTIVVREKYHKRVEQFA